MSPMDEQGAGVETDGSCWKGCFGRGGQRWLSQKVTLKQRPGGQEAASLLKSKALQASTQDQALP